MHRLWHQEVTIMNCMNLFTNIWVHSEHIDLQLFHLSITLAHSTVMMSCQVEPLADQMANMS